jgi:hypothetical protein
MSTLRPETEPPTVRVRHAMNDHDAMCVEVVNGNATRHIVDYRNADVRRTLAALPEGASLPLRMEPLEDRANVWRAVGTRSPAAGRAGTPLRSGD